VATAGGAESFGFRINLGLGLAADAAAADKAVGSPPADAGASHGAADLAATAECGWRPRLQRECDRRHRDELQNCHVVTRVHLESLFALCRLI
jgi:hypothetical protein